MKGAGERVARATAWLVAGRIYSALCALATTYILAQQLALGDLGRFTFYLAVLALLKSFGDLASGRRQLLIPTGTQAGAGKAGAL